MVVYKNPVTLDSVSHVSKVKIMSMCQTRNDFNFDNLERNEFEVMLKPEISQVPNRYRVDQC